MNKDQMAIFESYRDDILSKFKQNVSEPNDDIEGIKKFNDSPEDLIFNGNDDDDDEQEVEKLNVVVKNEEIGTRLHPILRAILRRLPEESQDTEILHNIKAAIAEVNSELDEEDEIKDTPLKVYETLVDFGAMSEEERTVKASEEGEISTLQNMEDDLYSDDDDLGKLSKRSDFAKGMKRDVDRGELEDEIRRMGTDWRSSDRDFESSSY